MKDKVALGGLRVRFDSEPDSAGQHRLTDKSEIITCGRVKSPATCLEDCRRCTALRKRSAIDALFGIRELSATLWDARAHACTWMHMPARNVRARTTYSHLTERPTPLKENSGILVHVAEQKVRRSQRKRRWGGATPMKREDDSLFDTLRLAGLLL